MDKGILFYINLLGRGDIFCPIYLNKDKKIRNLPDGFLDVDKYSIDKRSKDTKQMMLANHAPCNFKTVSYNDPKKFNSFKNYPIKYNEAFFLQNEKRYSDDFYVKNINTLYFDIEVETSIKEQLISTNDYSVILTIGYKINDGEVKCLTIDESEYLNPSTYKKCDKSLIRQFCDIIVKEEIDVIVSYNGYGFDLPKLIARTYKIDEFEDLDEYDDKNSTFNYLCNSLSRIKTIEEDSKLKLEYIQSNLRSMYLKKSDNVKGSNLFGRLHYDCYYVDTEKDQKIKGNNRSLKYLARYFNFITESEDKDLKEDIRNTKHVFLDDRNRIEEYQKFDVEILYKLSKIYETTNYEYCRQYNLPLNYIYDKTPSTIPRVAILREMMKKNIVPYYYNRVKNGFLSYYSAKPQGAIVTHFDEKGNECEDKIYRLSDKAVKIDFRSMYPSAICQLSLSVENTHLCYDHEEKDLPNLAFLTNEVERLGMRFGFKTFNPIIPYGEKFVNAKKVVEKSGIGSVISPEFYDYYKNKKPDNYKTNISIKKLGEVSQLIITFPDFNSNLIIKVMVNVSNKVPQLVNPLLPRLIKDGFQKRLELKDKIKKSTDLAETRKLDSEQNIIKVVMNSIYGLSLSFNGFLDLSIGLAVLGFCRYITNTVIDYIHNKYGKGYIVEVDTDGIIVAGDIDVEDVNDFITEHLKKLGFNQNFMILEKEKEVSLYTIGRKNYIEKDKEGNISFTGGVLISGKHSLIKKEMIQYLADNIFSTSKKEIFLYLKKKYYDEIKNLPFQYFVMTTKLKNDYGLQQTTFAARYSKYLKSNDVSIDPFNKYEYVKLKEGSHLDYGFLVIKDYTIEDLDIKYYKDSVSKTIESLLGYKVNEFNEERFFV